MLLGLLCRFCSLRLNESNHQRIGISVKHDSKDGTAGATEPGSWKLGQDSWERTAETGQLVQDSWERTAETGQLVQDSWERTAETGQLGKDSWERTAGKGQLRRDSWYRTARTGKSGRYFVLRWHFTFPSKISSYSLCQKFWHCLLLYNLNNSQ